MIKWILLVEIFIVFRYRKILFQNYFYQYWLGVEQWLAIDAFNFETTYVNEKWNEDGLFILFNNSMFLLFFTHFKQIYNNTSTNLLTFYWQRKIWNYLAKISFLKHTPAQITNPNICSGRQFSRLHLFPNELTISPREIPRHGRGWPE